MKNKKILLIIIPIMILIAGLGFFLGYKSHKNKPTTDTKVETKEEEKNEEPTVEEPEEEEVEEPVEEQPEEVQPEETKQEINIDEVIKKYKLDSIKSYINKDKEFFKEYASAVLNNENIDYPKQVLLMFKVFMVNDKYLDKNYTIESIKSLQINKAKKDIEFATYNRATNSITITDSISNSVFLHELVHFTDYKIAPTNEFFCYDNKKVTYTENCQKLYYFITNENRRLIIEGGAEVNTYRYFGYYSAGYSQIDNVYGLLSYLLGEKVMNDIFFNPNTFGELFKELLKYNITIEEYLKFLENGSYLSIESNFINKPEGSRNEIQVMVELLEFLSKLYKNKYNKSWADDVEFSYLMRMCYRTPYSYTHIVEYTDSKEYLKNAKNMTDQEKEILATPIDNEIIKKQIKDVEFATGGENTYTFFINDGSIIIFRGIKEKNKIETIAVNYDIKNEKVKGYTKVKSFSEQAK